VRLVCAVLVLFAAAPAVAHADTIVFRKGTDVWRMAPDGSAQTPLTGGERRYEWPSAADDGTIVASDETGRLWRMTLDGVALGPGIPTAATTATEDVPAETPTHVRISPDGTKIAYDQVIENVDPYFNNVRLGVILGANVWDTLLYRDPATNEYKGQLATSWKWIDDRTLELELRKGVKFHNGEDFDADDVAFTLNFASDPANKSTQQTNIIWISMLGIPAIVFGMGIYSWRRRRA